MLIKGFAEKNRMKSKNIAKEGMYDVDPKTGESPVATSVRKGNKLKVIRDSSILLNSLRK